MTEFNPHKLNNTNFQGRIGRAGSKAAKEIKTMEEHIKTMVRDILARAEREVPEYGDFAPVYEEFKNPLQELCATDFMLKITKPPKHIENHEKKRYLEVVAYKLPAPIKATRIIAVGNKEDILSKLKDKETLEKINKAARELSENLEDV